MTPDHGRIVYQLADFTFDPAEALLMCAGTRVELQPKVHAALHFLLQRCGQLVTREELMAHLWPDTHVNEEALTQIIRKLRRALDDDPREPRFVQTVLKRGYRFLLPVRQLPPAPAPSLQPPRTAYDPAWYVPRQAEERTARAYLSYAGMPVVLLGPERFGKTWLLKHVLREEQRQDAGRFRVIGISLDSLDGGDRDSPDHFLRAFALRLVSALGRGTEEVDRAWGRSMSPQANLSWFMEHDLLKQLCADGERLVLAIDRADALWGCPFQNEVFGLLRAWAEHGSEEAPWSSLRLVLAISTTPALLISDPSQSPFNLSDPIRLSDFDEDQVGRLLHLHGISAAAQDLDRMRGLVGGHPYLVRLLLYTAREQNAPLAAVLEAPLVFDDFLRHCRSRLRRQPDLYQAFCQVANDPATDLGEDAYHRLHSAGLVVREGPAGPYRLRYRLYQQLAQGAEAGSGPGP